METLILQCPYLANPQPETAVLWTRAGNTIDSEENKYEMYANGSLVILGVTPSDSRNYTCKVTNDVGTDNVTYTVLVIGEFVCECMWKQTCLVSIPHNILVT
jgi:hypothetical protein